MKNKLIANGVGAGLVSAQKERGITLIALVITIIILLILAGVTIAMVVGDNGILSRARNAKEETDISGDKEKIRIAIISSRIIDDDYTYLSKENFEQELTKEFSDSNVLVEENEDKSFIVSITKNGSTRKYYIDENEEILRSDDILIINNPEKLIEFRNNVNGGNSYEGYNIFLTGDITLNSSEEWEPIGNDENPFYGTFDGKNHSISGMKITSGSANLAFFGVNKGIVKKLKLLSSNTINISDGNNVAGIVGKNYGKIENCENNINITGGSGVAGICARNEGETILNCINNGDIKGNKNMCGGIVGYNVNEDSLIENCGNNGNVTSEEYYVGGICGGNRGKVKKCYNKGSIKGNGYISWDGGNSKITQAGGIVGQLAGKGLIEFCYNSGYVYVRWTDGGGICGDGASSCKINNCYNCGKVRSEVNSGIGCIGGYIYSSCSNCYYLEMEKILGGSNRRFGWKY